MATHFSILAWRIPWAEEPGGLQSIGLQSQTRLCWVFVAARVFLSLQRAGAISSCGAQASHCGGFSHCGAWVLGQAGFRWAVCGSGALEHRLNSTRA